MKPRKPDLWEISEEARWPTLWTLTQVVYSLSEDWGKKWTIITDAPFWDTEHRHANWHEMFNTAMPHIMKDMAESPEQRAIHIRADKSAKGRYTITISRADKVGVATLPIPCPSKDLVSAYDKYAGMPLE